MQKRCLAQGAKHQVAVRVGPERRSPLRLRFNVRNTPQANLPVIASHRHLHRCANQHSTVAKSVQNRWCRDERMTSSLKCSCRASVDSLQRAARMPLHIAVPIRVTEGMMKTRIVVAADRTILVEGMVALLQKVPGFEVVGHAEDGLACLQIAAREQPDIVLVDVLLPGLKWHRSDATFDSTQSRQPGNLHCSVRCLHACQRGLRSWRKSLSGANQYLRRVAACDSTRWSGSDLYQSADVAFVDRRTASSRQRRFCVYPADLT